MFPSIPHIISRKIVLLRAEVLVLEIKYFDFVTIIAEFLSCSRHRVFTTLAFSVAKRFSFASYLQTINRQHHLLISSITKHWNLNNLVMSRNTIWNCSSFVEFLFINRCRYNKITDYLNCKKSVRLRLACSFYCFSVSHHQNFLLQKFFIYYKK